MAKSGMEHLLGAFLPGIDIEKVKLAIENAGAKITAIENNIQAIHELQQLMLLHLQQMDARIMAHIDSAYVPDDVPIYVGEEKRQ
jgi:hypothetical protein